MNFFRNGWRGPMLKFSASLEELVPFLSQRLNDEAEIDIMIDQNKTEVATRCLSQPLFLFQIKLSKYAEAIGIVHVFFFLSRCFW